MLIRERAVDLGSILYYNSKVANRNWLQNPDFRQLLDAVMIETNYPEYKYSCCTRRSDELKQA